LPLLVKKIHFRKCIGMFALLQCMVFIIFGTVVSSLEHREYGHGDTRLQIKGRKKSARPPICVKFCTLTPASVPEIMDTAHEVTVMLLSFTVLLWLVPET
jgi:hypothetical protein